MNFLNQIQAVANTENKLVNAYAYELINSVVNKIETNGLNIPMDFEDLLEGYGVEPDSKEFDKFLKNEKKIADKAKALVLKILKANLKKYE